MRLEGKCWNCKFGSWSYQNLLWKCLCNTLDLGTAKYATFLWHTRCYLSGHWNRNFVAEITCGINFCGRERLLSNINSECSWEGNLSEYWSSCVKLSARRRTSWHRQHHRWPKGDANFCGITTAADLWAVQLTMTTSRPPLPVRRACIVDSRR